MRWKPLPLFVRMLKALNQPSFSRLLDNAKDMIEVNVLEDPLYHPADNWLG